ncbi:MAG: PEP-CTERM sorting domain-containing protein [Terracidiphilus sp.]
MRKQLFVLLALALAIATPLAARADSFSFTFSDAGGVSGSGTLTGTYEGAGNPWLITGGSGTFTDPDDTGSITLISNPNGPGASANGGVGCPLGVGCIGYDDLLDLFQNSGSYLDEAGLLFEFGGGDYLNLFFSYSVGGGGPNYYGWYDSLGNGDYGFESATGSFAITSYEIPPSEIPPTPEPGSYLLLGTGLCALAGVLLRKRLQPAQSLMP